MKKQGTRYAIQENKEAAFSAWYKIKKDLFIVPKKKGRPIGTDPVWLYLAATRNETIHAEQTEIYHAVSHDITTLFKLKDHDAPDSPQAPVAYPAQTADKIWGFKELNITNKEGDVIKTLPPLNGDVLTICTDHIGTLENLIKECEAELRQY